MDCMRKKVGFPRVFLIFLLAGVLIFGSSSFVSAEDLNMKVTGIINGYNSDFYLKTNSGSTNSLDPYDMQVKSNPDNYSQFYSNDSSTSYSIDSWNANSNPRSLITTYYISTAQTGDLELSWEALSGEDYEITLTDCGSDSACSSSEGTADMRDSSSYTASLSSQTSNYFQFEVTDYVAPTTPTTDDTGSGGGGGGGGGGGSAPSKEVIQGEDVFLGNKFMDVYMAIDSIKYRKIDLYNPSEESLSISLSSSGLTDILSFVDREDLSFILAPGERRIIDVKLISPTDNDVFSGKIRVNSGKSVQEIDVKITATKQELWFDAEISIPWEHKIIQEGESLHTQLNLLPVGIERGFDVKTSYTIKDFEGRLWFDEQREFWINESYNERVDFPTQNLIKGEYILELILEYPNGVATSRSNFEVRGDEELFSFLENRVLYLFFGIASLVILISIILIIRSYKKIKKQVRKRRK
jgi:hypothetical protein